MNTAEDHCIYLVRQLRHDSLGRCMSPSDNPVFVAEVLQNIAGLGFVSSKPHLPANLAPRNSFGMLAVDECWI